MFDLPIKQRGWASEIRSISIYLSTISPGLTAGVDMKEAWREIQENQLDMSGYLQEEVSAVLSGEVDWMG